MKFSCACIITLYLAKLCNIHNWDWEADAISGSATGGAQGALDRVSGMMLSDPLMCLMSVENSAMYDSCLSCRGDLFAMLLRA